MLPVYHLEWRGPSPYSRRRTADAVLVSMTILGTTKELVEFHVLDDSLFLRPRLQILTPERLLGIADTDFQRFNTLQKSNLVEGFVQWPPLDQKQQK
jgi:hypothetical protein